MLRKCQWRSSQRSGSAFWLLVFHQSKARNKRKGEDLCAAEDRHGLTGLSGMIIHTDYDDDDSKSADRFRQNCLISTRGPKASQLTQIRTTCKTYKAEETSKKPPIDSTSTPVENVRRTEGKDGSLLLPVLHVCTGGSDLHVFPSSNPLDQIRSD